MIRRQATTKNQADTRHRDSRGTSEAKREGTRPQPNREKDYSKGTYLRSAAEWFLSLISPCLSCLPATHSNIEEPKHRRGGGLAQVLVDGVPQGGLLRISAGTEAVAWPESAGAAWR